MHSCQLCVHCHHSLGWDIYDTWDTMTDSPIDEMAQCEKKITKSLKTHLFYLGLRSDIWYQKYLVLYPNNGIDGIRSNNHSPTDAPKPFSCLHTPTIWLHWLVKPSIISFLKDCSTTDAPTTITSLYFSCPLSDVLSFQCMCCVSLSYANRSVLCDSLDT